MGGEAHLIVIGGRDDIADVVVIGGGPAGCATAITCAMAGLSVTLLERASSSRGRANETLHPGVEPVFMALGVQAAIARAGFTRPEGYWVEFGADPTFRPFGPDPRDAWCGYHVSRSLLDAILRARAVAVGVRVLQPARALELIWRRGAVAGAVTTAGAIMAEVTVDASGSSHWLARQGGFAPVSYTPPLLAFFDTRTVAPDDSVSVTDGLRAESWGWTWTARVTPSTLHWTRLAFEASDRRARVTPLSPGPSAGRIAARAVTWRRVRAAAGPGFLLAGDAAGVLDPAVGRGVLSALLTGVRAGECAIGLCDGVARQESAMRHGQWVMDEWQRGALGLCALYGMHPSPPAWLDGVRTRLRAEAMASQLLSMIP